MTGGCLPLCDDQSSRIATISHSSDAVDGAGALAGEARGADLDIHLEDATLAERQRVPHLDAVREPIGVVHRETHRGVELRPPSIAG
jgi:hypothetical protein